MRKGKSKYLTLFISLIAIGSVLLLIQPPTIPVFSLRLLSIVDMDDCTPEELEPGTGTPYPVIKTVLASGINLKVINPEGDYSDGSYVGNVSSGATPKMTVIFHNSTCDPTASGQFKVIWYHKYGSNAEFIEHTSQVRTVQGQFASTIYNHTVKTPIVDSANIRIVVQMLDCDDWTCDTGIWNDYDTSSVLLTVPNIPPPPPDDSDGDGIPNSSDSCPTQKETMNGYQDSDGCPDTVPDTTKPIVAISSPTSGASLIAGNIQVTGQATDNVDVTRLEYSFDGGTFNIITNSLTSSGFTFGVNVQAGSHSISVKASDATGNTETATVSFVVTNLPPVCEPPKVLENGHCVTPEDGTVKLANVTLLSFAFLGVGIAGTIWASRK